MRLEGLDPGWYRLAPESMVLAPGEFGEVYVELHAPANHSAPEMSKNQPA